MYFWKVGHFEALPVSIHMKLAFLCLYGLSLRFYLLRNESCLLILEDLDDTMVDVGKWITHATKK
ncbi:hypothetical protein AtNW77_Chr2g0249531 [Arabidopsis thaliana]